MRHALRMTLNVQFSYRTRDCPILHVQQLLGHKDIDNTLVYIQLDKQLFQNIPDDCFIIRAAHNLEEAIKLGEVGFEPFMTIEGVQLLRKRK